MSALASAAAGPATRPAGAPDSRQAAGVWIDRADREIAAAGPGLDRQAALQSHQLAVWADELSPDDRRKSAASALVAQAAADCDSHAKTKEWARLRTMSLGREAAEIDDGPLAARLMVDAEMTSPLPPTTSPTVRKYAQRHTPPDRAFILVRLGRTDEAGDCDYDSDLSQDYVKRFMLLGRDDLADGLAATVRPRSAAAVNEDQENRFIHLAQAGFFFEAIADAESAGDDDTKAFRLSMIGSVAVSSDLPGARACFPRLRAATLRLAAAEKPTPGRSQWAALWPVMSQSAEIGDRAGVDEIGTAIDQSAPPADAQERAAFESDVAACYARVGELVRYQKHVARAESALADIKDDPHTKAVISLRVANAHACAGESAGVDALSAAAERDGDTTTFEWQNDRDNVAVAYIASGHLDEALRFEEHDRWRRKETIVMSIALKMAAAGRFDDALALTGKLNGERNHVGCLCGIAEEQIKRGKTDEMQKWIDRQPMPAERALVDLGVADSLLGKKLVDHWLQEMPAD